MASGTGFLPIYWTSQSRPRSLTRKQRRQVPNCREVLAATPVLCGDMAVHDTEADPLLAVLIEHSGELKR